MSCQHTFSLFFAKLTHKNSQNVFHRDNKTKQGYTDTGDIKAKGFREQSDQDIRTLEYWGKSDYKKKLNLFHY